MERVGARDHLRSNWEGDMTDPSFDINGDPTLETLTAIAQWDPLDAAGCLDFVRAAWHWPESASDELTAHEGYVVYAEPGARYLRLATGGWSGNEGLIAALRDSDVWALTWRLQAAGGLYIFRYPRLQRKPCGLPLQVKEQGHSAQGDGDMGDDAE